MTYIVHGATGAQGSPVLSALQTAGKHPVAAVRSTHNVPDGVASVAVDLADADSLAAAYRHADGVFVHLPMGAPEQLGVYADAIAAAIAEAKPGRVVISTSGGVVDEPTSPIWAAPDSPLATLIRKTEETGVPTAVVTTRIYLENLLLPVLAGPAREEGVLRYPLGESFPVSWISHQDVADVVVRLFGDLTVTGTVGVGHLPGLTGPDLAAAFTAHLGRPVRFEAITPEAFGELLTPLFGPEASAPVAGLYQALSATSEHVISESTSAQKVLGLSPRSVTDWLSQVAA
ncbi:NmrA family NAD(P)-binding protein [Streptomyces sp. NPDC090075]|uniref:NmrA family NAD(P)-binding protein n=1 Tax=Streptomyces sp. NPDC090075 TaxID=3365937 RepID=UPI003812ABAD